MSASVEVLLVGAVDPVALAAAAGGLVLDLDGVVCLTYERAADGAVRRRVSDSSGLVYDERISEAGTCACCAAHADVVTAVQMLADQSRWACIVCAAPAAATLQPLAHVLSEAVADDQLLGVELACVVQVVDLASFEQDLLGDDLLDERGLALAPSDRRSVGEALVSGLEFADVVIGLDAEPGSAAVALLGAVCDETTQVRLGWSAVDAAALTTLRHDHELARSRVHPLRVAEGADDVNPDVWTLQLQSTRPLDPARLLDQLEQLGSGAVRGRGYFWLASRPDVVCVWDGVGGQLSIGVHGPWDGRMPQTHLVVTGTNPKDRDRVAATFPLVCCDEPFSYPEPGEEVVDGFEPWLGRTGPWEDESAGSGMSFERDS